MVFLFKPGYCTIRVRCWNFISFLFFLNFVSLIIVALLNKINDNVMKINKESINIISKLKGMYS